MGISKKIIIGNSVVEVGQQNLTIDIMAIDFFEGRKPFGKKPKGHGAFVVVANWVFSQLQAIGKELTFKNVIDAFYFSYGRKDLPDSPIVPGGISLRKFIKQNRLKIHVTVRYHERIVLRRRVSKLDVRTRTWDRTDIQKLISNWRKKMMNTAPRKK